MQKVVCLLFCILFAIMDDEQFMCNLCCFGTNLWKEYQHHYIRLHKNDPNFSVTCTIGSCSYTTRTWNSFKVHVHRKHKFTNEVHVEQNYDDMDVSEIGETDNEMTHFQPDQLVFQNSLYAMSLEAKHNISQSAVNDIISSTGLLVNAQLDFFKQKVAKELENRSIDPSFIYEIHVDHLLDDFDSASKRFSFYENCSDLPYVKPVDVVLDTRYVTKKGRLIEQERLGYYIPLKESLNKLLELPEIWNHVVNPHTSTDEFLYDLCDGEYIQSNILFKENPQALQLLLNTDDLEIVNPLGCHVKKHKITMFYYLLGNIPPQFRSKLSAIQLVAIARTKDVRENEGIERLLHDFLQTLNQLSSDGVEFIISGSSQLIKGALVAVPADTLASNWLGKFKEGVAFARKNCRMCEVSSLDLKNRVIDHQCQLRDETEHSRRCTFIDELSKGSRRYWSKLWGIYGKSCLMGLTNFSITSGLVQDPMHVFLEGIVPRDLGLLLFHLTVTKKYFTLKWLNDKIRTFPYSYLHLSSKPEDTFDKGDLDCCTRVKQSSSSLLTLCQVIPLIVGPKVPFGDENWINFLRLVQIVLLCTSSYCHRDTASLLRILIAIFLEKSKELYPKSSFIPKKHFIIHFPRQMIMFGPLRHHWCMRFEGKHGFFKSKKVKNFKNLPYSLARHHQLYMCLKQTGIKGEMSNNFLYDGDSVQRGEEINFTFKYPNLRQTMADLSQTEPVEEWMMYSTQSVSIHGLHYKTGCAVVLEYDNDVPVFAILRDIVVYHKEKYFILEGTNVPSFFSEHILHYILVPDQTEQLISFQNLKFKWPLSVYMYDGNLVTMNSNSHTFQLF